MRGSQVYEDGTGMLRKCGVHVWIVAAGAFACSQQRLVASTCYDTSDINYERDALQCFSKHQTIVAQDVCVLNAKERYFKAQVRCR